MFKIIKIITVSSIMATMSVSARFSGSMENNFNALTNVKKETESTTARATHAQLQTILLGLEYKSPFGDTFEKMDVYGKIQHLHAIVPEEGGHLNKKTLQPIVDFLKSHQEHSNSPAMLRTTPSINILKILKGILTSEWTQIDERYREFMLREETNRNSFDIQVVDISRLLETIADMERRKLKTEFVAKDWRRTIVVLKEEAGYHLKAWKAANAVDDQLMRDLLVELNDAVYMLTTVQCKSRRRLANASTKVDNTTYKDPLEFALSDFAGGKPDCRKVSHTVAKLAWGDANSRKEEKQAEMDRANTEYEKEKTSFDTSIVKAMEEAEEAEEEAVRLQKAIGDAHTELKKGTAQKTEIETFYSTLMMERKDIGEKYINFDALRTVRDHIFTKFFNNIEEIVDCARGPREPGECSLECIDNCIPNYSELQPCGEESSGKQTVNYGTTTPPNEYGIGCPDTTFQQSCNEFVCPTDCVLSYWGAWSPCTKECEGGVKGRTRTVEVEPKNGGESCDTTRLRKPVIPSPATEIAPCMAGLNGLVVRKPVAAGEEEE